MDGKVEFGKEIALLMRRESFLISHIEVLGGFTIAYFKEQDKADICRWRLEEDDEFFMVGCCLPTGMVATAVPKRFWETLEDCATTLTSQEDFEGLNLLKETLTVDDIISRLLPDPVKSEE